MSINKIALSAALLCAGSFFSSPLLANDFSPAAVCQFASYGKSKLAYAACHDREAYEMYNQILDELTGPRDDAYKSRLGKALAMAEKNCIAGLVVREEYNKPDVKNKYRFLKVSEVQDFDCLKNKLREVL